MLLPARTRGGTADTAAAKTSLVLANTYLRVTIEMKRGAWRLTSLARADGRDALAIDSDEFEILLFDGSRYTAGDYIPCGVPVRGSRAGRQTVTIDYRPGASAGPGAPQRVSICYTLGAGPYVHKYIRLTMRQGQKVDRLEVMRFSTGRKASRGGQGQPVFIGNWFSGVDYPGFYSRHSDGFVEPNYMYRVPYRIDLEGSDHEYAPRKGLVTLFHFPGYARPQPDGSWGIRSKTAVMGVSRREGEGAEIALLDYIAETRKTTRSYLNYNNWFSGQGKILTVDSFVNHVYRTIRDHLSPYGVNLDAMTADHGWENSKTFTRIFDQKTGDRCDALPEISKALEQAGTHLGAWIAFDGTNQNVKRGEDIGYRSAYGPGFDRSAAKWLSGKEYFDILDGRYLSDLKRSLRMLLVDAGVDYIKHDFNHNFTSRYISQRHARERCLDTTLDLLAYERKLNPRVFQNYTNGTWFSPWWLQAVDTIWMMSGDAGGGGNWPELTGWAGATTYRDKYFFQNFGNPARCARPVIPIADFMTHGIIFTRRKPYARFKDTLQDWSDYVVMYFARGTRAKELYIDPDLLSDGQWKVLGRAAAWAVRNQQRLHNTVFIGGDPDQGRAYGYVSWVDGRAILSVRNPGRCPQGLTVPFDRSVYYRGPDRQAYRARCIYPFVEAMPWRLTGGRAFDVTIPAESVEIFELEPGSPTSARAVAAPPLPPAVAKVAEDTFELTFRVPDEQFQRCELIVLAGAPVEVSLDINATPAGPSRFNKGKRWAIHGWDLRSRRGEALKITGRLAAPKDTPHLGRDRKVTIDAWLIADRKVDDCPPAPNPSDAVPFAVSQGFRRVSRRLISGKRIEVGAWPKHRNGKDR